MKSRGQGVLVGRRASTKIHAASLFILLASISLLGVDFKVQRGVATVSGTSATLSAPADFEAVSGLDKAFVRITNSQHTGGGNDTGGGNQNADDVTTSIQFDSTSQITISRFSNGANTRVCWEIVEYIGEVGGLNEIVVRDQGVHALGTGTSTNTVSFSGASSTTGLVGFVCGVRNSDAGRRDYHGGLVTLSFDDASTLRFTRGFSDPAVDVAYAVVDFVGSAWTVQRIEHTYSASGSAETESISSVVMENTFIHAQKRNGTGLDGLDEFGHQVWLSGTTQASFQLQSGANSPSSQTSVAWIISNPYMNVERGNGNISAGGSEPWTSTLSITAVDDLTNASVFWNNDCTGTGTAFPRPMVGVRLTAVDTVEMWRSDTGQAQNFRFEVAQWPYKPVMHYYVSQSSGNDSTGDGSAGTPWATISHAMSQSSSGDTIEIVDSVHTEAGISVDKGVTITGAGADYTILQSPGTNRIMTITTTDSIEILDMTLRNGVAGANGGAILVDSAGSVLIENCDLTSNLVGGSGGAVFNNGGTVTIRGCSLTGNTAGGTGGAIHNDGSMNVYDSLIAGNTAGAGGGFESDDGGTGALTITNSTISGNQAAAGGGFRSSGTSVTTVYNSTIYGNTATGGNGGGGIQRVTGTINLYSVLVAGNSGSPGPDISASADTHADHCLIEDTSGLTLATDTNNLKDGAASPVNVAALADNGGTTLTHALLSGSAAINAGDNPQALSYDQRGAPFARSNGAAADVGAYESQEIIGGIVYNDKAKTNPVGAGKTVALSINGGAVQTTTTDANGAYSFNESTPASGQVVLAYLDGGETWQAFHGLYSTATGTNITTGNGTSDYTGNLIKRSDGSNTGANIAITWLRSASDRTNNGDKDPAVGTDAYNLFNGNVNLGDNWSYCSDGAGLDFVTVTFSNLDPTRQYTAAFYTSAHNYTYDTQFQISGVSSAVQASSSGIHVTDNETVDSPFDNETTGYLVQWTDIVPSGSSFTVTCSAYGNRYGLPPLAIMLEQQPTASDFASTVTVSDGSTQISGSDGLDLVLGEIILEHKAGSSITNAQLDVIDGVAADDEDGITISGSDATFAAPRELWISSGANYEPGGNVDVDNIDVSGTLTMTTQTLDVSGNWNCDGTFDSGTSTTVFSGSADATISGSATFHNWQCLALSKIITFEQSSTQTVGGKFEIDGDAFGTRVELKSSGGAGTTWNLVLNGIYDCRYVAVQGSTASGSAFLPINPVGFKDDGDNTNWYDAGLPSELLFFDDFETSTLGASPPDKASSNWTINSASWLDEASEVVNTQNHTTGGSQSMYSRGGPSNTGVGAWNSPSWGPQTNCTAEAWFYDDMQNNKMQWLFIDNAAGDQGVGVLVETNQSTTKYRYCRYNFGGGTLYADSYIDRTLGWHKVKWVHTEGTVELYLDGALLMTATGLSDFSDYDTGSWNWHNTTGSTPMWFDDFMVYRSQHQSAYRWYDNDDAENPTSLAAENTAISRDLNTVTRLRVQIESDQYEDWSGTYIGLQYREGSNGTWTDLGPSNDWDYANGLGTDQAQVANALLTGTDVREHFIESVPSAAINSLSFGQTGEWDICVVPTSNATIGATYYLRPVVTDASGNYGRDFAAYLYTAQCVVTSPTLKQWTGSVSNDWNNPSNWASPGVPDNTYDVIIPAGTPACRVNITGAQAKSILVESGASLLLDTASTSLTVSENLTVYGTVTHSSASASLTLNTGTLRVEGASATYNHSGNGAVNAANATIQVINGGTYDLGGAPTINVGTLNMAVGGLFDVSGAATLNVNDYTIDLNGQWISTNVGNTVNVANNFANNGSMLGSTGGVFNFTGTGKTFSGSSTTTIFYQTNFAGSTTITMSNNFTVLDDFDVQPGASVSAGSGTIFVGGDWTNQNTFNPGSGTVTLNGSAAQNVQTGTGGSWNNLVVTNASGAGVTFTDGFTAAALTNTTANSTMTFKPYASSADLYTITGAGGLTLGGSSGQEINLRSSTPASRWNINPSGGSWSVNYVDVQDSFNVAPTAILPTNSIDSGNTINWFVENEDSDGNGLEDWWEYTYFDGIGVDQTGDPDGDLISNFVEQVIGTDPVSVVNTVLYVDDDADYTGNDGSAGNPYKYLKDAIDNASDQSAIFVKKGYYELNDYACSKRLYIKGEDAAETIVKGPLPQAGSGDVGQMLDITASSFFLSDLTIRLYKEEKPVVSHGTANGGKIVFNNLIFKDNSTGSKSLIAPTGSEGKALVLMLNCLAYDNTAAAVANLRGQPVKAFNNTIVDNTATGFLVTGSGNTFLQNDIIRGNTTQITNDTTGNFSVKNCNVQGGFAGAIDSYDQAENFIDAANNFYRLTGAPGVDAGTPNFLKYDLENKTRPQGSGYDVGAYEAQDNDTDADGLTNAYESANGTNPNHPDSDLDGFSDGDEINIWGTDPTEADTDGDFVNDGDEPAIGMDPTTYDGVLIINVFDESFEDTDDYPEGEWSQSVWGKNGTTYTDKIIVSTIGSAAYDGSRVVICQGRSPESGGVSLVPRNGLTEYWIYWAFKIPRAKLPTNKDQACCVCGVYIAIDENGYLCVYDGDAENWRKDTQTITEGDWFNLTIHRNHAAKTADVWVDGRPVFTNMKIAGVDPDNFIRISFSSVGEYDVQIDKIVGLDHSPF